MATQGKTKWWEESVDEIFMGVFICLIAVVAMNTMPEKGDVVATASVSALAAYLGSKGRQNKI